MRVLLADKEKQRDLLMVIETNWIEVVKEMDFYESVTENFITKKSVDAALHICCKDNDVYVIMPDERTANEFVQEGFLRGTVDLSEYGESTIFNPDELDLENWRWLQQKRI